MPFRALAAMLIEDFLARVPGLSSEAGALQALTTAAAQQFNRDNPQVPGVAYYAYAGSGTGSRLLVRRMCISRWWARPRTNGTTTAW
jgi:hypothetical protein